MNLGPPGKHSAAVKFGMLSITCTYTGTIKEETCMRLCAEDDGTLYRDLCYSVDVDGTGRSFEVPESSMTPLIEDRLLEGKSFLELTSDSS
ncbi:hypothetical protein ACI4BE_27660, partial [Klebsiella pneumoniae]|uniref:hypothetical protein n=1 Tax=Klebsiella pneumoniae TaxID=573 RepID=UPI003853A8B6